MHGAGRFCLIILFFVCPPGLADRSTLRPLPEKAWDARAAAHLLTRSGFGATAAEVARLAALSREAAVAWVVDYEARPAGPGVRLTPREDDPEIERRVRRQLEVTLRQLRNRYRDRKKTPALALRIEREAEQRALGAVNYRLRQSYLAQLRGWWLRRMVRTQRPLEEKMALFWHGHFATGVSTIYSVTLMQVQNALFRRHATGNFGALLRGVSRDPAMLRYLDGVRNVKRSPNENFARELLELFTLGRGNFTEQDVRAAARAFTGWTSQGVRFFFNRYQHDYGVKTFLGQTGRLGGTDVLRILLAHPATARRLATKLCRFFVGPEPGPELVGALAASLRKHDYAIKPVLRELFRSAAFYSPAVMGRAIKSPTELIVGAIRTLGLPGDTVELVSAQLARMGQTLFDPPNVKGWDGGRAWINSSTLLVRYNLMYDLVIKGQGHARERRRRDPLDPVYGWTPAELLQLPILQACFGATSSRQVVEILSARLLTGQLSPARRAQLQAMLWTPDRAFDASRPETRLKMLFVMVLLTATPEYQLH